MKKFLMFTVYSLLLTVNLAFAEQGTCSWHGGVNCSAGSDFDGSVVCTDGWRDSSESYSSAKMCQTNNKCDASILISSKQKYNVDTLFNQSMSKLSEIDYLLNKILQVPAEVRESYRGQGATESGIQPIISSKQNEIRLQITALKPQADAIDMQYDIAYNQAISDCITETANRQNQQSAQLIQSYTPTYNSYVAPVIQQDLCKNIPNTHKDSTGVCVCDDGFTKNTTTFQCEKVKFTFTSSLFIGSSGNEVLQLQIKLKSLGYLSATPNGYYGRQTQNAVKAYQKANNILVTGNVGSLTRAKLNS